jgi:hypothetical protein
MVLPFFTLLVEDWQCKFQACPGAPIEGVLIGGGVDEQNASIMMVLYSSLKFCVG